MPCDTITDLQAFVIEFQISNHSFLSLCPSDKTSVFRGTLESACLSVCVSVHVQHTTFCQSAGGGIDSHSVTALVYIVLTLYQTTKVWTGPNWKVCR